MVRDGATFIMNGGEIYGNSAFGVHIRDENSRFEKTGGVIFGNVFGDKSNPAAIRVFDNDGELLAYREDTVTDTLSITLNSTGNGVASKTGNWNTP